MLRKGEVVSLGIFVILGLLVGGLITGGAYEIEDRLKGSFEDKAGSVLVEMRMGFYGPDGEPVHVPSPMESFFLPEPEGPPVDEVTDFILTVTKVVVTTKEITNYGDMYVDLECKFVIPGGDNPVIDSTILRAKYAKEPGDFDIQMEGTGFKATTKTAWQWSVKDNLLDRGNKHNLPYKQTFTWEYRGKAIAHCAGLEAKDWKAATVTTIWQEGTSGGTSSLAVVVSVYGDPISFFPSDSAGLSMVFACLVIFIGLWYWQGRKLLQWG